MSVRMNGVRQGNNVQIIGVRETTQALKAFAPYLQRRMRKEIKDALEPVANRAHGKYPKGDWKVKFSQKNMLGQIVATAGGGTSKGQSWGDAKPGVRAAIFEFAGSKTSGLTPQAEGLINSLNARYGQPGRFLWAAWDELGKGALDQIVDSVKRVERDLQATLDRAGEDY